MAQRPAIVESRRRPADGIRILLADDCEAWRVQVRSLLRREGTWTIVSEACDGLEAVKKAEELHPDVVLLDLNMPGLNGIEAAKKIRQRSPSSSIIFVSQEGDEDIVAAALKTGAEAYVLKSESVSGLIPAIRASLWANP